MGRITDISKYPPSGIKPNDYLFGFSFKDEKVRNWSIGQILGFITEHGEGDLRLDGGLIY